MMKIMTIAAVVAAFAVPAVAQVPIQVVVQAGVQQNPTCGVALNGHFWCGDRINAIVGYSPNVGGTYSIDPNISIPGGGEFSYVGQIFPVSPQLALVAIPDNSRCSDNRPCAGVWTLGFDPAQADPVGNITHLVPDKGLAGATSVALGPDLKPYVGFLRSPNLVRINGNQVESVGGAPNGQPILSQVFNGNDDYLGTSDGFYVVSNVPACSGNKDNCGRPVLIAGGTTVAVANDNAGHVYFAQSIGVVRRLNLSDGTITAIASGLSFGSITAGLLFDENGNLLICELSQIDLILAVGLAAVLPAANFR